MPKAAPPITASDRPLCDHCHKLGQTSDRRFKNHPELVRCTTCKKFGHFHYACTAAVARTTSTSAGLGRPVIEMTDDGRRTIARYICEQFDHGGSMPTLGWRLLAATSNMHTHWCFAIAVSVIAVGAKSQWGATG